MSLIMLGPTNLFKKIRFDCRFDDLPILKKRAIKNLAILLNTILHTSRDFLNNILHTALFKRSFVLNRKIF